MKSSWLLLLALVVALNASAPAPARAGGDQEKSIYGNYPAELHKVNPLADDLARARKRLEVSIRRFWDVYANQPWNYWAVVSAYYAYADAYHLYVWTLRRYWEWEHSHHRFSGRVLTRDVLAPIALDAKEQHPTAAQLEHLPREVPVPNAVVTLSQNLAFLAGQPLAKVEEVKEVALVQPAHLTIARPQSVWTVSSDDRGRFDFVGIPRGSYHYRVTADGFHASTGLVEIGANRQERDIHLNRHRLFRGQVFTVTRDCVPFLRPLLARAGTAPGSDAASADEVEKILGSDQRILPQFRRLIPADGARVKLVSNLAILSGPSGPGQVPGQLAGDGPKLPEADKSRPITFDPTPSTVTGQDGRFRFENLPQTSYRVTVEKPGYLPFNALITLERAQTHRRIVIFPFVPSEPGKLDSLQAQPSEAGGTTLNDPFTK